MIKLPSLQKTYRLAFSGDSALRQAPVLADNADEAAVDAFRVELSEYIATLTACQQTGDWAPLTIGADPPTWFDFKQIDIRPLIDRVNLADTNPRHINDSVARGLLVRMALVNIVGVDFKIVREPDPRYDDWVMAQPDVIIALDTFDKRLVNELGWIIWARANKIPKT